MAIPSPDGPTMASSPSSSEVTITIADGRRQVSAGQMVRYLVEVRNASAAELPVTIKLTVPARSMATLEAADAAVVANAVAWKNVVAAGETRTYSLAGRVAVPAESRARKLDVTACVHAAPRAPAVACATDHNELDAAALPGDHDPTRRMAWIWSILFGILAVVGAVWLYRKVNPELLTPANAREASPVDTMDPPQPGGAPSA